MKEIRVERKQAFQVIGLHYHGRNAQGEIPALWRKFMESSKRIPMDVLAPVERSWGVCYMELQDMDNQNGEAPFDYYAALEVTGKRDIPKGMAYREVPAATWLVFEHKGPLTTLEQTYHAIYNDYLPTTRRQAGPWCLEMYDKRFDPTGSPESVFEIWVQVKE